jgi:hypothetical protein
MDQAPSVQDPYVPTNLPKETALEFQRDIRGDGKSYDLLGNVQLT